MDYLIHMSDGEDCIIHMGRKGMKWYQNIFTSGKKLGSGLKKKALKIKADQRKKSLKKKREKRLVKKNKEINKPARKMTDAELNKAIERLEKERKYKTLKNSQLTAGKKFVRDILRDSGKRVGTEFSYYIMGNLVNTASGKKIIKVEDSDNKKKKVKVAS